MRGHGFVSEPLSDNVRNTILPERLSLTDTRFRYVTLINWIPEDVLNTLFNELGTCRNATFEPIITKIANDTCTPDPANPTTSDDSAPGILSFQATIRFLIPK